MAFCHDHLTGDEQFITDAVDPIRVVQGEVELHAMAWDDTHILSANYSIDQRTPRPMHQLSNALWAAPWDAEKVDDGRHTLRVVVTNKSGRTGEDAITIYVDQSGQYVAPTREAGDSVNNIGPYLEKGILGTQLGPNKNGRKWQSITTEARWQLSMRI